MAGPRWNLTSFPVGPAGRRIENDGSVAVEAVKGKRVARLMGGGTPVKVRTVARSRLRVCWARSCGVHLLRQPLLYPVARAIARLIAVAYFRGLEVSGREHVPARGPVILAANHPQSITDALVLGLATDRVVHFVAHSGLFRRRIDRWLLRGGGVIPIHRPREVESAAQRNEASFRACRELLERGGCLGIFPEGTSQEERRVQRFKTGTVRIALDAEEHSGFGLGVVIVPVGLSFQSQRHFRSRVLVTFDEAIHVAQWRDDYLAAPEDTVLDLTSILQERIRHGVVDVQRPQLDTFVRDVERVYKGELLARDKLAVPGSTPFERDQALAREIARASEYFYETRPELLWSISELLDEYRRRLERLRLPDRIVKEEGAGFRGQALRLAVLATLGAPFAGWGLLFNYVPYKLTGVVARRMTRDSTKTHSAQIVVGSGLFLTSYALWAWIALQRFTGWEAAAFLLSLPLSGLFAHWFVVNMNRRRRHLRWAYLRSTRGLMVQRIQADRREIIDAMDAALAEYLARPGAEPRGGSRPGGVGSESG